MSKKYGKNGPVVVRQEHFVETKDPHVKNQSIMGILATPPQSYPP